MTITLIAIIVGIIGLDQLTKWIAVWTLEGEPSFPIWQDVLHLTYARNEGAAFGILSDQRWVFLVFSTVAIIGLLIYLFAFPPKQRFVKIVLAMIIGGGIGNMIDRTILGYVIDFIDFTLIDFAIFNVADSFICVGAFLLIGYLIGDMVREIREEQSKKAAQTESESDDGSAQ